MNEIRFEGDVAIVTGASRGLGRQYALDLAKRGARLVLNNRPRSGGSNNSAPEALLETAQMVHDLGGEAVVHVGFVERESDARSLSELALDVFGRIDILVLNAGILADKTFAKMPLSDFERVIDVHVWGAVRPLKFVWPVMMEQHYGRIVLSSSPSALYGNFGQANYTTAKMAVIGLMQTLRLEAERYDMRVNVLCPLADTGNIEGLMPKELADRLSPGLASVGMLFLASRDAPQGAILTAGGGVFALNEMNQTEGIALRPEVCTPEQLRNRWKAVLNRSGQRTFVGPAEQIAKFERKILER
jgi:NAD(P)-dependent dehydrogenase (short-subunit alcohol dehydrogenase family)